jgi:Amt family ammonium transporter
MMRWPGSVHYWLVALLVLPTEAWAGFSGIEGGASIAWMATAAGLVFLMQAGFALLESGMSRSKNAVNVLMKNFADMAFGALFFWALGFGLMFGTNTTGWLGVSLFVPSGLPGGDAVFLLYQMMFATTAATIVSGAVAERIRYVPYVVASVLIIVLIYPVFGSWAWGSAVKGTGWLAAMGFHDFAGGTVVHSVGGWAALAGAIVLGPRFGRYSRSGEARNVPGHNLTLVALGIFILWFGWYGFNGGSTLLAQASIGGILLKTQLSAAAGLVGALVAMTLAGHRVLLTQALNGALGGLVAITAGCDVIAAPFAVVTGLVAGLLVVGGSKLLERWRVDDVVGAIPVHAFCGAWGTLAVGLFNAEAFMDLGAIGVQAIGLASAIVWTFPTALMAFLLVRAVMGLRASTMDEQRGLDFTEHAEIAYPEFQQQLSASE